VKYGSGELSLSFGTKTVYLKHREPERTTGPEDFRQLLASRLPVSGSGITDVGIVVADKTRLCQYPEYLPVLTRYLTDSGISPSGISFYIAYGTHAPQTEQECLDCYGETFSRYRFVHHSSRAAEGFRTLGTTSGGTVVRVAEEVLRHQLIITFGAVLHHYFAGYGGGRKLLFPGMGAYASILQNHSLFLDFPNRSLAPGCRAGQLDGNPLAGDLEEISRMLPPRLEIHALLNSRKEVCELYAGQSEREFREVCQRYDRYFRREGDERFDLVVASAGGYPKDINFIQAHKSVHNAASFVKNGGKLVIFAECRDGLGNPDIMELFARGGREKLFGQLENEYRNNAGTVLAMLEKTGRIHIHMVTGLDASVCEMMGARKCTPEEAQSIIDQEEGKVAVLENAGMLYG
jgi:lactate racemase